MSVSRFILHRLHSSMAKQCLPVVIVLGATGTGKSKLAIALAQRFGGEVINADAMQIYRGLDIITNKISDDEQAACPHHLLGFLDPLKRFTVVDFRNHCLPIVDRLRTDGRLPVIVGGTHYYLESVLWKVLMDDPSTREEGHSLVIEKDFERGTEEDVLNLIEGYPRNCLLDPERYFRDTDSVVLHNLLKRVDPDAADQLHYNDKRKIMRSLQVFAQHGKKHSQLVTEQKEDGGNSLGGPLRYDDAVMIWLQCDQEVLDERLDARVNAMHAGGLVAELRAFHQSLPKDRILDYSKGIFQSIGLKELHNYLINAENPDDPQELAAGLEAMKRRTRKYSRRQVQWIQNRFLKRADRQLPPVFGLDASDMKKWGDVEQAAFSIVDAYVRDKPLPVMPLEQTSAIQDVKTTNICAVCQRTFSSLNQWKGHLSSHGHRIKVKRKQNRELAVTVPVSPPKELIPMSSTY